MFRSWSKSVERNESAPSPRVIAIVSRQQILEVWHIHHVRSDYRERDVELPKILRSRTINGQRQRYNVYRRQVAHQLWGHFVIRRYQATRMMPWMPSVGLMMLIPGTLLAAGTANQGLTQVPTGLLILQSLLITVGGAMAVASGWRILRRLTVSGDLSLASLGVSAHALGFPADVSATDQVPTGFRPGRFKGALQVELPIGDWSVVDEQEADGEWHSAANRTSA